jgi:hypothetical protein
MLLSPEEFARAWGVVLAPETRLAEPCSATCPTWGAPTIKPEVGRKKIVPAPKGVALFC